MGHTFIDGSYDRSPGLRAALERLDRLVDWERRDRGKGQRMRQSIAPARDLLERLGSPERSFRCIHVAGTKGKGSVASLIDVGLRRSGARVGLYGSPHVETIHERVRLNGRNIDDEGLAQALTRVLDAHAAALEERGPAAEATWFDVLTAAAFLAMSGAELDWAVVECGLGGRLDSTNVIRSEVAVLTNVDLEHTAVLGDTYAQIAREKAGIIDPGSIVVSGVGEPGEEAADVVDEVARRKKARLVRVGSPQAISIEARNAELAGLALAAVGIGAGVLDSAALEEARLPGRLERRRAGGRPVVLDGAHVPNSLDQVLRDLQADPGLPGTPVVVFGTGKDKDAKGLLKVLEGRVDRVLCTSLATGPVLSPEALCDEARRAGHQAEAVAEPRMALDMALSTANPDHWILVTGSLHLVGELRGATVAQGKAGC